jgi:structural maintenance of chromosome 3 (chondroitin sulfate proteoglycan 6)
MKEELLGIERYQGPKERSLAQASSNLEAMLTTKDGLEAELHQVCSEVQQSECSSEIA